MEISLPSTGRAAFSGIARKSVLVFGVLTFGLLFPTLVALGGSTNLINWGPGLLLAGAACLLLPGKEHTATRGGVIYSSCFLAVLGLLWIRAGNSQDAAATANNSALLALAAVGYLIGNLADASRSRGLFVGLALVSMLNLLCTVMQVTKPEWNLVYPQRTGGFPSGLFAHYSYSAAFCLGTAGLLISRSCEEGAWLKSVLLGGAVCALVTIPLSLSRGGNLALAIMVAMASALLLARAFRNSRSIISAWLPALVLLSFILISGLFLVPFFGRNGPDGFYTDNVRISFWKAAAGLSMEHPWIGGGAGSFAWNSFRVLDSLSSEPGMTHNEALQLAVEYGYPALIAITALIAVPVGLCFRRFVTRTASANTSWAALGLLAMLAQSNFESIFHTGPGVLIAALVLGQISHSLWHVEGGHVLENTSRGNDGIRRDRDFPLAVRTQLDACSAGDREAVSKLISLLSRSKDEWWNKAAYRLTYWTKVKNEDALRAAVKELLGRCSVELGRLSAEESSFKKARVPVESTRGWRITRNLALAGCAASVVLTGAGLTRALVAAWLPLYHPKQLSISTRFTTLLSLAEEHPGLGLDRKVMAAGMDCIYQYESPEAREYWAEAYRARILRAIPGWRTDPGAALQLAEITGWAGDVESALEFYNHAIAAQGNNESLFMANAFKGQYLYELCISAAAAGQSNQQRFYAQQAFTCFQNADAAMRLNQGTLSPFFLKLFHECEILRNPDL